MLGCIRRALHGRFGHPYPQLSGTGSPIKHYGAVYRRVLHIKCKCGAQWDEPRWAFMSAAGALHYIGNGIQVDDADTGGR